MQRRLFSVLGTALAMTAWAWADQPAKPSIVPAQYQWVRSFDAEGNLQEDDEHKKGLEHFHFRLRYLDPDVNAFVGMQTDFDYFNHPFMLGNGEGATSGNFLWDMGANIGIVRKKSTWELDLMGVTAAGKLGPALAVVYEHRYNAHWMYYNRTQGDILGSDGFFDLDQGVCLTFKKSFGVTAGYRVLTSTHQVHGGPRIGIRYSFDSPKIPFIFPSLG